MTIIRAPCQTFTPQKGYQKLGLGTNDSAKGANQFMKVTSGSEQAFNKKIENFGTSELPLKI